MSLITQQTLLQARSDRDDALHRLSVGEDTTQVRNLLNGANKRIAKLEAQMKTEQAEADARRKAAAESSNKRATRQERAPLPEDMDISCVDCSNCFNFKGKDQVFYAKNSWTPPVRCADCREARKNAKPSGKNILCVGCKTDFFFSDAKSRVFEENGWTEPKRCHECAKERKAMAPLLINCGDCSKDFSVSVAAQKHIKDNGWSDPKRCKPCREKRSDAASTKGSVKSANKV